MVFLADDEMLAPDRPVAAGTTAYARSKSQAEVYVRRPQEQGAPIRISYPAGILGPDDPGMSALTNGLRSFLRDGAALTSSGMQTVDARDLAALLDELTGTRPRRVRVPGPLLRAAGSVGDAVKRVRDFDYPLTRDMMEFTTQWPGADTARTTRELGVGFRAVADTFRDTLSWMYRAGHLTAAQAGRLADTPSRRWAVARGETNTPTRHVRAGTVCTSASSRSVADQDLDGARHAGTSTVQPTLNARTKR